MSLSQVLQRLLEVKLIVLKDPLGIPTQPLQGTIQMQDVRIIPPVLGMTPTTIGH